MELILNQQHKIYTETFTTLSCYNFWQITSYGQFRQYLKIHLFRADKSQNIVTLDYCVLYNYSYLLTNMNRF